MTAEKVSIAYVLSLAVAENVFMGGAMVTDGYGLPLEFRYTEPVRATKLQRVLYGDVLEKYLHGEVIAASLIGRLEQRPDLVLVADPNLLVVMQNAGKKAALITQTHVSPLQELGAQQEVHDNEFLLQLMDNGSPVRVRLPEGEGTPRAEIVQLLCAIGRTMDVMEPLTRVETAIKLLWEDQPEA